MFDAINSITAKRKGQVKTFYLIKKERRTKKNSIVRKGKRKKIIALWVVYWLRKGKSVNEGKAAMERFLGKEKKRELRERGTHS